MNVRASAAVFLAAAGLFAGCTIEGAPYAVREGPARRFPNMAACEREVFAEEPRDRDLTYSAGYVCRRRLLGLAIQERRWWLREPVRSGS